MNRVQHGTGTLLLAAAFLVLTSAAGGPTGAGAGAVAFAADTKKSVDAEAVFYGDAREWSKPAAVDDDAVFGQISEYKEILEKNLSPSDAKYGVLMSKARAKFLAAVRSAAKAGGYDLVARVGAVRGVDNVPVVTQDVIAKL